MKTECRHASDAAAYLTGDLSARARAEFAAHIATCPECEQALDVTRSLLGRLRSAPQTELVRDLTPSILARLHSERSESAFGSRWPRIAAAAALMMCLVGGSILAHRRDLPPAGAFAVTAGAGDGTAASVNRALEWFCQNQEPDGSWDASKWGGNPRFEIALTALPALALLSDEPVTPTAASAAATAALWLRKHQTAEGAFGPDFQGAPYNQSIATLALLRAYRVQPDAALKQALDASLIVMIKRQTSDGGWGYLHSPSADRAITEWHLEALRLASALGWKNARPHLLRGQSWLAAHAQPLASAGPGDVPGVGLSEGEARLPEKTKLDFCRAYFLTAALKQQADPSSRQRLEAIRRSLLLQQESAGLSSGSWPADDRWGRTGGRLYSTALASLAISGR